MMMNAPMLPVRMELIALIKREVISASAPRDCEVTRTKESVF